MRLVMMHISLALVDLEWDVGTKIREPVSNQVLGPVVTGGIIWFPWVVDGDSSLCSYKSDLQEDWLPRLAALLVDWFPGQVASGCRSQFSYHTWSGRCLCMYLVSHSLPFSSIHCFLLSTCSGASVGTNK